MSPLASVSLFSGFNEQLRSSVLAIDMKPDDPDVMDDEFDDGSFDTSKWTWMDQGSATASESNDSLFLTLPDDTNRVRGIYQSSPTAPWVFRAKVIYPLGDPGRVFGGLFAGVSTSGEIRGVGIYGESGVRTLTWSTPSSSVAAWGIAVANKNYMPKHAWVQLAHDGTGLTSGYSPDGQGFRQTGALASFSPTIIGLAIANDALPDVTFSFEWFRRVV